MATKNTKDPKGKDNYVDKQSEDSKRRTTTATSQDELKVPTTRREDLPEADRKNFHRGVYSGPGTGVAPAHTDTGGADTTGMEEHPKMGTTGETAGDAVAGGAIGRSSAGADQDSAYDEHDDKAAS